MSIPTFCLFFTGRKHPAFYRNFVRGALMRTTFWGGSYAVALFTLVNRGEVIAFLADRLESGLLVQDMN